MLTASYPSGNNSWIGAGKDHEIVSPATVTVTAVALLDPDNKWDVIISYATSEPASHPTVIAHLPPGYTMTGGGAFVAYTGAGNLLTASFPNSASSWEARSKDHDILDPARITAYAIGLRSLTGLRLEQLIRSETGAVAQHPSATVSMDRDFAITGGGAINNWTGAGNLLTASVPAGGDVLWAANGKDHIHPSPSSITVYAIGIAVFPA